MKSRIWKHKQLPIRVIERTEGGIVKEGIKATYDVQVKKHHIWCNSAANKTKAEVEAMLNMELK